MDRLTRKDEYGYAVIIALSDSMDELYAKLSSPEYNALFDAIEKLADYEEQEEKNCTHAAERQEVEYGENISEMHYSDEFKCSKCNFTCEGIEEKLFDDGYDIGVTRAFDSNFCPKCGAKMQKKSTRISGKLSNDCLEILDEIEEFRHKNETTASHDDYTIRLIEAIIAKHFGITDRNEWCDLLKQDKNSKYYAHCKAELPLIFTYGGTENE